VTGARRCLDPGRRASFPSRTIKRREAGRRGRITSSLAGAGAVAAGSDGANRRGASGVRERPQQKGRPEGTSKLSYAGLMASPVFTTRATNCRTERGPTDRASNGDNAVGPSYLASIVAMTPE
jgi:hypothetical protein